jgi:hypothetical protein
MKNLLDKDAQVEIVARIHRLDIHAQRLWGKMEPDQMLAHCTKPFEMVNSNTPVKMILMGRILTLLPGFKARYYNDVPWQHNLPTAPDFVITEKKDLEKEKAGLIAAIEQFVATAPTRTVLQVHPLFGKLTNEQWGKGLYKHVDHHLRQFGV